MFFIRVIEHLFSLGQSTSVSRTTRFSVWAQNKKIDLLLLLLFLVGWDWVSWYCGHYWPILPAPDDRWWWLWRNLWNKDWQGKPKYSEKTCPSATLSTTNPTWLNPGPNPGRRGGKAVTNRLSYDAAASHKVTLDSKTLIKWTTISFSRRILFHGFIFCPEHLWAYVTS
jgi:hypothetical protein